MPSFIKNLLVSAVAVSAAAIERRDASTTIMNDMKAVNGNLTGVTKAADDYKSGLLTGLPLLKAEMSLESSISSAGEDATNSEQLDSASTKQVLDYINNTLEPNVGKVLAALKNKKPAFTEAKIDPIISMDVDNLQKLTDSLGKTLVNKVASADQKQNAQKALDKIDADFKQAKNTWKSTDDSAAPAPKAGGDAGADGSGADAAGADAAGAAAQGDGKAKTN